jgi:hypothetical protein
MLKSGSANFYSPSISPRIAAIIIAGFDVDHAITAGRLDLTDSRLIQLLREKLSVSGNGPVDVSPEKRQTLRAQVATQLRPVLRAADFDRFDLGRAFALVANVAKMAGT